MLTNYVELVHTRLVAYELMCRIVCIENVMAAIFEDLNMEVDLYEFECFDPELICRTPSKLYVSNISSYHLVELR